MKVKKVLIFPAGTEIAFEIWNALKFSKFVELYGANSMPSHAEFVFERCDETLPFENDERFIDALNALIDKWKIEYIYPAHDSACMTLTRERDRLHAKVVTSPLKTVDICRSKRKTYEFFAGEDFLPFFWCNADEIKEYPVFIKPAVGQASVGARKINTRNELDTALLEDVEYVICEYLSGNEYTIDCFTDRHGKLRACHMRQRERIKTGISVRSSLCTADDTVQTIAERINSKLEFNGAWFFQLKKNTKGEYRLLEISPRIPGTMGVSRNLGINYPMLTLFNMWGYDIEITDNKKEITLDRAFISRYKTNISFHRVYLDFDDTLYLGNKVNIQMIAFLYQCMNQGIKVTLLTKHAKDIHESLIKYRISEALFDEIVCVEENEKKANYIIDKDSIFIDDSFAERLSVQRGAGIPVFDLDMVESLMDWRM